MTSTQAAKTDSAAPAFRALAYQFKTQTVNKLAHKEDARNAMNASIVRLSEELGAAKAWVGSDLKLVVLPEYFLTGFPMGDGIGGWAGKAALESDGAEYEALGLIAQNLSLYLSGNAYEQDSHFPGVYFQTSFIIEPSGGVILRYRRLISMYAPSPYDYLDRYVDIYGEEALFPVAQTEIGNLACIASEEILYPEIARCFALKGAEVFLHSSSEPGSPLATPKNIAKQARAIENMAYVVSANSGGLVGMPMAAESTDGGSKIVDYNGLVHVEAYPGETMTAYAELDLGALRRNRAREGMSNLLSRQPLDLYAREYAKSHIAPVNFLLDEKGAPKHPTRAYFKERQQKTIAQMKKQGLIQG